LARRVRERSEHAKRMGSTSGTYHAREATDEEVARIWPQLVRIWPAYQTHYDRSGQRSIFILEPM
jgi:F420H(2)-dependent quinone reductase